jgi:hypothetical protein
MIGLQPSTAFLGLCEAGDSSFFGLRHPPQWVCKSEECGHEYPLQLASQYLKIGRFKYSQIIPFLIQ